MKKIFEGGCQYGAITCRVTGVPVTLFAWHCTECQRQSSSAFGMALWIKDPEVKLLSGQLKEWVREMPSGKKMSCQFCPNCGTRIFHKAVNQTQTLSIKPGTLNSTSSLMPVGHIWISSKQKWLNISKESIQYEANPDSFEELIAEWARQNEER